MERVLTCWLHLQYLEVAFAGAHGNRIDQDYSAHQRDTVHNQYLAAIEVLARLRGEWPAP